MNLVNSYVFTPPVDLSTNTEIGGVASTISTPALLATKLAIDVSRISNFTIVGSDIKCRITGSYVIPNICFYQNTSINSYIDSDGLVTDLGGSSFRETTQIKQLNFKGIITMTGLVVDRNSQIEVVYLENCISILGQFYTDFYPSKKVFYIPRVVNLGATVGYDAVFYNASTSKNCVIYCHQSLATNNGGSPDGDLTDAITRGANVRYVTSIVAPNPVTTLASGAVYNTAIQLNFTAPSSTNAIDYYELYNNGVFVKNITASGQYITGLTASTSYIFTVIAVDVFYNKSAVSNILMQSTDNYSYTDVDANTYISATSLTGIEQESGYKLIVDLKSNSLWGKIQAIYPFKGTTAAQHKFNAKNPIDTNEAFRLAFTGTATFSNLGYQLNGSSYANTYLIPSITQSLNSNGMTVVCGTNIENAGDNWAIASYNSGTQNSILSVIGNGAMNLNGTRLLGGSALGQIGIFTATKQSATVSKLFKNGVQKTTGNSGGALPTNPFYIGAIGNISYGYIKERIQMAIIHEGLSDVEVTALHSIIDLSEAIAGRKTW